MIHMTVHDIIPRQDENETKQDKTRTQQDETRQNKTPQDKKQDTMPPISKTL
jgi:hypothetical protein